MTRDLHVFCATETLPIAGTKVVINSRLAQLAERQDNPASTVKATPKPWALTTLVLSPFGPRVGFLLSI